MTVTDDYLANNARYAEQFSGPLPLPPSKHVAVVACMDARLDIYRILGLQEGEAHVIRPTWSAEAFSDLDEDVRQSLRRIETSPFITKTSSLRGFVFDVATGRLDEVGA
jgi:carbonic anhydrase